MKRIFVSIITIVLIFSSSVIADDSVIDKGSKIIGATGYLMYQAGDLYETGNESRFTMNLAPNMFFFTGKGTYIGPEILFYHHSRYNYDESHIGIGPRVGFILNQSVIENSSEQYSLYYFSLFATVTRITVSETDYYYGWYTNPETYKRITKSNNLSYGVQVGTYNMIRSHVALDFNLRLFVDKFSRTNSSYHETGYTIMLGLGLAGFLY